MKKWAFYIITVLFFAVSAKTKAQVEVGVQINIAPPVIPVYAQPVCPVEGYLWIPGYWAYGPDGYYWVPSVWVFPPRVGFLWTPGYWGFVGGFYSWHAGYWGPHIGFYGGVNYGFGYYGTGFCGGRWEGGVFNYNRAVYNINSTNFHNYYEDRSVISTSQNRTSFNGQGGVNLAPTHEEESAMRESHLDPTKEQVRAQTTASTSRNQLYKVNGGRPASTAIGPSAGQSNGFNRNGGNRNNGGFSQSHSGYAAPVGTRQVQHNNQNVQRRSGMQPLNNNGNQNRQQMQHNNFHQQGGGQRQFRGGGGQQHMGGGQPRMGGGGRQTGGGGQGKGRR